jgi:hypothetical protein
MVETAAHLADHVMSRLPVRQWVLSVPKRLRYTLQSDPAVQTLALQLFLGAVEQRIRQCCPGADPDARIGAVAFTHRFGALLNAHVHFHCIVVEGVFDTDAAGVQFHEARALSRQVLAEIQATVPTRLLRALTRCNLLEREDAQAMAEWKHGSVSLMLTPLELLDRLPALIPPPRRHRHRYYDQRESPWNGVLAPNAPLRSAVTARAAPITEVPAIAAPVLAASPQKVEKPIHRRAARHAWALLLARIYEALPLLCPKCGGEMRIIAFITEVVVVRDILLARLGEATSPSRMALARGPPLWEVPVVGRDEFDLQAQPAPDFNFDQRIAWQARTQDLPILLVMGRVERLAPGGPRQRSGLDSDRFSAAVGAISGFTTPDGLGDTPNVPLNFPSFKT